MQDENLISFFKNHLSEWEPGHEEELNKASKQYIKTDEQKQQFKEGFFAVMKTMDTWWSGMASEIIGLQKEPKGEIK